jgi:hypothetical protein
MHCSIFPLDGACISGSDRSLRLEGRSIELTGRAEDEMEDAKRRI